MQALRLTADQGSRNTLLAILYVIVDLSEFNLFLASLNLLYDLARFEIEEEELRRIIVILEDHLTLTVMKQ